MLPEDLITPRPDPTHILRFQSAIKLNRSFLLG